MTTISFQIPLRPISLNSSHRLVRFGNRASRIKTSKALEFEKTFKSYLDQLNDLKESFLKKYNPLVHGIEMECYFYTNYKDFFTQSKKTSQTISNKSMDLDNMIKPANDSIFRWLGIDDSQVIKLTAEKIPTNGEATMVFRISLALHPAIFAVSSQSDEPA